MNLKDILPTKKKTKNKESKKDKETASDPKSGKGTDKKSPAHQKPPSTSSNTPGSIYLDTFNKHPKCEDDRKQVTKKCEPQAPQDESDEKKGIKRAKKAGLSGKLAELAETFDTAGKLAAGYKRDKHSVTAFDGNGWMEDHCTGMWFTPTDVHSPDIEKKLNDMLGKLENSRFSLLKKGFDDLKDLAIEKAGDVAIKKAEGFAGRTVLKEGAGAVFGETVVVPIAMGIWTIADAMSTAKELAELAGSHGKAAYDALMNIKNIGDKTQEILEAYKTEPHRAHADAMSLMAQIDPCLRARKCLLVPYKNTDGEGKLTKAVSQAKHGNGCCPGQTGHHILPDAMVDGAGCPGYDYDNAPTICLEGTKNGFKHGSHGMAHGALSASIKNYKRDTGKNTLSYEEAKKQGIAAVRAAGAAQCDPQCLEAQLDAHYKGCVGKELNADAGTGGNRSKSTTGNTKEKKK